MFKKLGSMFRRAGKTAHLPVSTADARPLEPGSFDAIADHVVRHIDPSFRLLPRSDDGSTPVDLIVVEPSEAQPFWSLLTVGMAELPMSPPERAMDCKYAELMIRLPVSWPMPDFDNGDFSLWQNSSAHWPVKMLHELAMLNRRRPTWFWSGHHIDATGGRQEPFEPGVGFTFALLHWPTSLPESFATLMVSETKGIGFFSVIPIFPAEAEFCRRNGSTALVALADPATFDILDVNRPSLV